MQLCPASGGNEAGHSYAGPAGLQDSQRLGPHVSMALVVDLRYAHNWAVIVSSCRAGGLESLAWATR
jgi:hypothetical protein